MATDALELNGLMLAPLTEETQSYLAQTCRPPPAPTTRWTCSEMRRATAT